MLNWFSMKKLILVFVLFVVLLSSIGFYIYYSKNKQITGEEKIVYNPTTQKWEKTKINDDIDRETIKETRKNEDGFYNQSILRGYFEGYDGETNTLKIKSTVSFTQQSLFEIADLKINPAQIIYCAPETYTDPNNGKTFEVRSLTIPVKDGQILYLPTERVINFENFLSQTKDSTYLIVQLTQNFDKEKINYVQKMIVIGLCE